ncbi:hypothetical protein IHE45_08G073400 [Dioscorea alata]|uniref:Uncharacterized protein n=2 Tax=Dioscorea alata TaxID=55571 RepID=A0ACB7VKA1_DIOAL|nr:hypothetical protein IHE45_08G073400 [Dioscorea alata]KAH7674442.1 hypothetical protein IHE45_08G073400 [Dioscorea alata]
MSFAICSDHMERWKSANQWMRRTVRPLRMCTGSNFCKIAKRKLDESVFLGNRLHVSYAPEFESPSDTKEKLEGRKKEVINRVKSSRDNSGQHWRRETAMSSRTPNAENSIKTHVSSNKDYFSSSSMNVTVQLVRDKLEKIQSSSDCLQAEPSSKRPRIDNRRRI